MVLRAGRLERIEHGRIRSRPARRRASYWVLHAMTLVILLAFILQAGIWLSAATQ